MKIRYDALLIFRGILDTAETCIGLIWHGLYTQRAEVFRNKKSRTKYFMRAISQRKAAPRGSSTMRNVPRSRRSAWPSRYAERAAPLWTARRNRIAPRRRCACRSRSAALNVVRRRFTASAPALRAASLCHACRLRSRRIQITRNRPGLGETVAPQKWRGVKESRHALAFGKREQRGEMRWTDA